MNDWTLLGGMCGSDSARVDPYHVGVVMNYKEFRNRYQYDAEGQ